MFRDREEAGQKLGEALLPYKEEDLILLAIPKGGVEVAYQVAKVLDMDFHLVASRKLRHPSQPELAFGAIAEDKNLYLNPSIRTQLPRDLIQQAIRNEKKKIDRQISKYRQGGTLPPMKSKTVILIDDGIATGSTLLVTIQLCRKKQAGHLMVAAPVSSPGMLQKLNSIAEEVVILETPGNFTAVSQVYGAFPNLDDDVLRFLKKIGAREN